MSKPKRKKNDDDDIGSDDDNKQLPMCQFGSKCYRKNPDHLRQYRHPPSSPAAKATAAISHKRSRPDTPPRHSSSSSSSSSSSFNGRSSSNGSTLVASSSTGGQWVAGGSDSPVRSDSSSGSSSSSSSSANSLPPCKWGISCYRKNLLHFSEYSHPIVGRAASPAAGRRDSSPSSSSSSSSNGHGHGSNGKKDNDKAAPAASSSSSSSSSANGNDNSSNSNGEKKEEKKKTSKSGSGGHDDDDDLSPAHKLSRSYSSMSEEERKELIFKAMMEKEKLQKDLEQQRRALERQRQIAEELKQAVGRPAMLDGEKEAMEAGIIKYFQLMAVRNHSGGAEESHFRLAESQFYRLLEGGAGFRVTMVEYVVSPKIVRAFQAAKADLEKSGHGESVLAFHGTREENIALICETGFRVPKKDKDFKQQTDTGWYGAGVYFSEYPRYSMDYIQGKSKLLLCQVLPGKAFRCTKLIHGEDLKDGYDSHTSPDGKELVIFNSTHILPSYVVHFAQTDGDFKYGQARQIAVTKPVKGVVAATSSSAVAAATTAEMAAQHKKMAKKKPAAMYKEASNAPDNGVAVLADLTFSSAGKLACTQSQLQSLIEVHHGSWSTSGAGATHFIISEAEAKKKKPTAKVTKMIKAGVPLVSQQWLYAAIITAQLPEVDAFIVSTSNGDDDEDGEEEEEEEDDE